MVKRERYRILKDGGHLSDYAYGDVL